MKALVQRVARASVSVNDKIVGKIGRGLVVFIGVAQGDAKEYDVILKAREPQNAVL
jgi:D-tyrosyl-tRNA(Tyr) deacylase